MDSLSTYRLLRLAAGEMFSFDASPGENLVVFDGKVWITQEGDLGDYVLATGETFACDRSGRALVEALVPTRLAVLADAPAALEAIGYEAAWPITQPAAFAGSMARNATSGSLSYA